MVRGAEYREARGGRRQRCKGHGEGSTAEWGSVLGEKRTQNMPYMVVTLEVSKLSGWLNADADCRESKGGHTMQGEGVAREAGGGGRPRCT